MKVARHSIELANIFAIAYYEKFESAWTLMSSNSFDELLNEHQLPRCRHQMGQLAQELGVDLQENQEPIEELHQIAGQSHHPG